MTDDKPPVLTPPSSDDARFRHLAARAAVAGIWLLAAFFCLFLMYHAVMATDAEGWMLTIIQAHFAATIGVPLSAISSVCIVIVLESTSGPVEFEALGFKFRGASGPVVLWLACFLAMILALRILWLS